MWQTLCSIVGIPMGWFYEWTQNYGVAILLFTVLVKLVLFPISLKQHKSSLAMVRLKPYQEELMKKYGSNRQKYSEELQKLYQREGYNPASSCLPMLIQMPLIFMMYSVVRRPLTYMAGWSLEEIWTKAVAEFGTKVGDKGITFLDKIEGVKVSTENFHQFESQILSQMKDAPINTEFLGLDLALVPQSVWKTSAFLILLIPILSGVTSFLMSWLSQKMNPAQQAAEGQGGNMKLMLYMMPLLSAWIAFSFPAGLGLYWLTSNVLGIAQLFILNALYSPKKIEEEMKEKLLVEKQREKEKRAAAAMKKAAAIEGKKKKKKPQSK